MNEQCYMGPNLGYEQFYATDPKIVAEQSRLSTLIDPDHVG